MSLYFFDSGFADLYKMSVPKTWVRWMFSYKIYHSDLSAPYNCMGVILPWILGTILMGILWTIQKEQLFSNVVVSISSALAKSFSKIWGHYWIFFITYWKFYYSRWRKKSNSVDLVQYIFFSTSDVWIQRSKICSLFVNLLTSDRWSRRDHHVGW